MVLSLTFVPAAVALFLSGRVAEKENRRDALRPRAAMRRCSLVAARWRMPVVARAVALVACWPALLATRLGTEFIPEPGRRRHRDACTAHSRHQPDPGRQMQSTLEARIKQFPEVERVFGKIGTAEVATDPMPPSVADTFLMLKPRERMAGSAQAQGAAGRRDRSGGQAIARQQLRVHAADPDADERVDLRRARGCRDQGVWR